jgi:hypothetical protein
VNSLVALNSGRYTNPWTSAYVLCELIIGFFFMLTFVLWESKGAKASMVRGELFAGQRIVALAYIAAFLVGIYYYALANFIPLLNQTVL